MYKGVFGEAPNNLSNNSTSVTGQRPTYNKKDVESVTEMVTKYHNMSPSERAKFMIEINYSSEEKSNKKD